MNHKHLSTIGTVLFVIGLLLALASSVTDDLGVFMLALLLWFAGFGVIHLADRVRREENQKNPITEEEVTVVGHRMETHHTRYSHSKTFYMTFKPEDGGDKLEFEVPESDFRTSAQETRVRCVTVRGSISRSVQRTWPRWSRFRLCRRSMTFPGTNKLTYPVGRVLNR